MRIGFIGGIHEDIIRLKEAFQLLQVAECKKIVCSGDIVGFSDSYYSYPDTRDANESIALVRERCCHIVVGNHDLHLAGKNPERTLFSYPDNWNRLDLSEKRRRANGAVWLYEDELSTILTAQNREFIVGLSEYGIIPTGSERILISHYVYPNLVGDQVEFDAEDNGIWKHRQFAKANKCTISVFGHDLCDGLRIFENRSVSSYSFGTYSMPDEGFAVNGPWVANGTSQNGVMVLDLSERTIESIPLNTTPFKCPTELI